MTPEQRDQIVALAKAEYKASAALEAIGMSNAYGATYEAREQMAIERALAEVALQEATAAMQKAVNKIAYPEKP